MANQDIVSKSKLTALANAIRSKSGGTDTLTIDEMIDSIKAISGSINNDTVVLMGLIEKDITSIDIPNGVTRIGKSIFESCTNLTSITIPDSVTSIGQSAFSQCSSLTSITLPDSLTSIESNTFNNCRSLTSITIPNGVTRIRDWAFYSCTNLTSVTIGNSVTSISNGAFHECKSLATIDFSSLAIVPTLANANIFNNVASGCQAILPDALYDQWITATNWVDIYTNAKLQFVKESEVTN